LQAKSKKYLPWMKDMAVTSDDFDQFMQAKSNSLRIIVQNWTIPTLYTSNLQCIIHIYIRHNLTLFSTILPLNPNILFTINYAQLISQAVVSNNTR
jgi:hypothetical protein